jgi:hypothetical protein
MKKIFFILMLFQAISASAGIVDSSGNVLLSRQDRGRVFDARSSQALLDPASIVAPKGDSITRLSVPTCDKPACTVIVKAYTERTPTPYLVKMTIPRR